MRAVVAHALIAGLVSATVLVMPQAAHATALEGVITDVRTTKEHYTWNERLTLTFSWALPDGVAEGDTFRLDLPDELAAASRASFTLDASDGTAIATARWEGASVIFTLTDFVEHHDDISGEGHITARWDHSVVVETTDPIVLEFGGVAIPVRIGPKPVPAPPCTENCPPPAPPASSRALTKAGSWADGAFKGTRDQTGNLSWAIALPGRPEGFDTPVVVTDEVGPGSIIECSTITITTHQGLAATAPRAPLDIPRFTLACTDRGFTIDLDSIAQNEFIRITYRGSIDEQGMGVYTNRVVVAIAGQVTERVTTLRRTSAGGTGSGLRSVSVGDRVWLDASGDGRQTDGETGMAGVVLELTGPGGSPVTTVDGIPVEATVTDDAGRYLFTRLPTLAAGESYTVRINAERSASALAGLSRTTPGMGGRDRDSSTAVAQSLELLVNRAVDLSLDFGFVLPELPTLPEVEPPSGGETPEVETPPPARLASTGPSTVGALLLLSSTLMALGAASLGLLAYRLRSPRIARRGRR
ncbi:Ig-like domain-containing protein [Microcella sp.]|uniref:Ig-like domain-containing protein n=1 Tax=Microcella sp. TaxID=1913979 RepID=UPI003F7071D4